MWHFITAHWLGLSFTGILCVGILLYVASAFMEMVSGRDEEGKDMENVARPIVIYGLSGLGLMFVSSNPLSAFVGALIATLVAYAFQALFAWWRRRHPKIEWTHGPHVLDPRTPK